MKYRNTIIALGFLVVIIQFLGFPQSWKEVMSAILGVLFMALAYMGGRTQKSGETNA